MKPKNVFKIFLDVLMTALFLLLINLEITGLLFHEIAGIGIFLFIVIHNVLNSTFIINTTKKIFSSKNAVNKKQILMYLLNFLLTIGIFIIVITGILISNYVLPNISVNNIRPVVKIHKFTSYTVLFLIGVHILIHLKYLYKSLLNIIENLKLSSIRRGLMVCVVFMFISIMIYIPVSKILQKNTNKQQSNSADGEQIYEANVDNMTLEQYLSSLRCTGCSKHCLLISPRCNVGESQAQTATKDYENGNITNSSQDSNNSTDSKDNNDNNDNNDSTNRKERKNKNNKNNSQNDIENKDNKQNNADSNSNQTDI